jgi:hypothetical protein
MKWFGKSWGAPVCEPDEQVETPIGRPCAHDCGKEISAGDRGVVLPYYGRTSEPADLAYHLGCFLRSIGIPAPEADETEDALGEIGQLGEALETVDRADLEPVDPSDLTKGFRRKRRAS